jgi:hypothetical protein
MVLSPSKTINSFLLVSNRRGNTKGKKKGRESRRTGIGRGRGGREREAF